MKRLYLLRHAKAEPDNDLGDHERALSGRGRKDSPDIGREIAARGFVPQLVLCSTARRTVETLELVLPFLTPAPEVKLEPALYHAYPEDILRRLRLADDAAGSVMLVGHNPGLHVLALGLSDNAKRGRRLAEKFPTCAFAAFESGAATWRSAADGRWMLLDEFRPADL